jgi:hypothetical protein
MDKNLIGEVIIKNTCFQYEHSLAAWIVAIFIALAKSDSNRKSPDNTGGNGMAILSEMKNGVRN